jgi:hypothetical protein
LQSKPPPERKGKPFKSFTEVMRHIIENEGLARLFKGIGPQLLKGIMVQGFLMMTKERYVKRLVDIGISWLTSLLLQNRIDVHLALPLYTVNSCPTAREVGYKGWPRSRKSEPSIVEIGTILTQIGTRQGI